jgi:pre-mRNA-splicing factor ATP-dependent RNA helicase DHX16
MFVQWVETGYSMQWCYENYFQYRSLKRARDVRDQLVALAERAEVSLLSNPNDTIAIRKVTYSDHDTRTQGNIDSPE